MFSHTNPKLRFATSVRICLRSSFRSLRTEHTVGRYPRSAKIDPSTPYSSISKTRLLMTAGIGNLGGAPAKVDAPSAGLPVCHCVGKLEELAAPPVRGDSIGTPNRSRAVVASCSACPSPLGDLGCGPLPRLELVHCLVSGSHALTCRRDGLVEDGPCWVS